MDSSVQLPITQTNPQLSGAASDNLPTLDTIVNAMKGSSATNHWDVVVSYSEDKLNQLLKIQYSAGKLVQTINISTTGIDRHGSYPLKFSVQIGSPSLQFIPGNSGKCKLTMPIIGGTYQADTDPEKPVPINTYQLIVLVPLVSISGSTGTVSRSSDIVTFSEDGDNDQHIILHFANEHETTYQVTSLNNQTLAEDDYLKIYLVAKLNRWFTENVKAFDYVLTSINKNAPEGNVILKPKSFVFTSAGDDTNGVLSLYIQTEGSGNPPGNQKPSFQPNGTQMLPIPKSHTASIILSHDLVTKRFFKTQLEQAGYSANIVSTKEGVALQLFIKQSVKKNIEISGLLSQLQVEEIKIELNSQPLNFIVKEGSVNLTWKYTQNVKWYSDNFLSVSPHKGTAIITIELNKTVRLENLTNEFFGVSISIKSDDFHTSVNSEDTHWYDLSNTKNLPRELEKLNLDMPFINLDLGSINFWATTNLMFPGQQVIDIDKQVGIKVPYDLLITGQIN